MKKLHDISIILGALLAPFLCFLQAEARPLKDTSEVRHFRIYYPINKVELNEHYMSNEQNLEIIRTYLRESPRIDSIVIYSYASPEGPYRFNKQLAQKRGETAKRYILSQVPEERHFPDSLIHLRPEAENWEGLREEILVGYHRPDREEVLTILDSDLPDNEKKLRLQRLDGRRSWRYILQNIMPKLRYATWVSVWQPILKPTEQQALPILAQAEEPAEMQPVDIVQKQSRTIMALKTNLLYDLLMWANVSVEAPFRIHRHQFSILYQHQFPWWTWGENDNKYCNRFLSIGGEVRWWLAPQYHAATTRRAERDCLTGWYIGLYGMGGKWDFEWKRDLCYQGEFWSTGLSVGYAMPLGRWANMEFGLSAGYANIPYRGFTPTEDYSQLIRDPEKRGTWHYVGPTRAEVSLVIPLKLTKTFTWKGGER